jgi:hypothetical protein
VICHSSKDFSIEIGDEFSDGEFDLFYALIKFELLENDEHDNDPDEGSEQIQDEDSLRSVFYY